MSKERELIKDMKILLECTDMTTSNLKWECTDMGSLQRNADVLISRAIELLAQPVPEQSNKWWYGKGVEDTKYFLTREPLSENEIREGNQSMLNATRETFIAGVRFAEVMHGITGVDDETV